VCIALLAVSAASAAQVQADRIVIVKSTHTMTLYHDGKVLHEYKVALGTSPTGPKRQQGDHRTPEGRYFVDARNGHSVFHLALHLSYPNAQDRANAARLHVSSGGDVEIHGLPKQYAWVGALHRQHDWTNGCIAVTNPEIEEIWKLVPVGTTVEIRS
jgi:murein L,D-transpeptidase YafK